MKKKILKFNGEPIGIFGYNEEDNTFIPAYTEDSVKDVKTFCKNLCIQECSEECPLFKWKNKNYGDETNIAFHLP